MKKTLGYIIVLFICIYPSICHAVPDISGGGGITPGTDNVNCDKDGCVGNYQAFGLRVTFYSVSGTKVSDSVDIMLSTKYDNIRNYEVYTTIGNGTIDKISYKKNGHKVGTWKRKYLKDVVMSVPKPKELSDYTKPKTVPGYFANWATYYSEHGLPQKVFTKSNICSNKYKCAKGDRYFAVFEPTAYVWGTGKPLYGTVYELANVLMKSNCGSSTSLNSCWEANTKSIDTVIREQLAFRLTIRGEKDNEQFYKNIKITDYCPNPSNGCFTNKSRLGRDDILNKGVGIAVYDMTDPVQSIIPTPDPLETIDCPVTIDIKECDDSTTIYEPTNKNCVVNNSVYALDSCNLYCSDQITTDFSGIYNTFIGTNKLNAIQSGKYQSIKGNPRITITKTCYQSSSANDCPNVTQAFKQKLNQDYKNNDIILNVDGRSYTLIGTPTISTNGYSSATITYEYKLDEIVNKYISIETMKGATLTEENKNKVIINGTPMIITNRSQYGTYNYNLDVSNTVLNKYIASSNALRNFKNVVNSQYNIENKMSITYNGKTVNSYNNENLNYSCSYVKFDASKSCICPEDTCCDSITCEPVECPCTCESEYGCLNDGKCTPIKDPEPCVPGEPNCSAECDPETEICFPNVVYRPISLTDPFPGIDGNGRIPGNNWNKVIKINSSNTYYNVADYYITNNRGYKDYEVYQAEPLYVIKLDSNTIKAIREYNDYKDNDYNDFNLECTDGQKCISKFLRGKSVHFSINLIDSGTCKNVTSSTFDSCITRKGA